MDKKSFVIGFFCSSFLGIILISLIDVNFYPDTSFIQFLLIFFVLWTAQRAITHILIFTVYFLAVRLLVKQITQNFLFYSSLFLLGAIYFVVVVWIDWKYSERSFKTFDHYLRKGNYYLIYTAVVVLTLWIISIVRRHTLRKLRSVYDKAFEYPEK